MKLVKYYRNKAIARSFGRISMLNTDGNPVTMGDTELLFLKELSGSVKSSKLALPQFQRPNIWTDKEKRELIVSLCMDVPIGSFLVWEYEKNFHTHKDTRLRAFEDVTLKKSTVEYLLIDGQQRLQLLTGLTSSDFGLKNYVRFEKSLGLVRPRVLAVVPKIPLDNSCEIQVSDLAGLATGVISSLSDPGYQKMAKGFRKSLHQTQIPVRFFEKHNTRQWVLYVYQTCNLAGKGLTGEDYVEAALSFYYPTLAEQIEKDLGSLCSSSSITGIKKKITRSVFLKAMIDEIYNQTSFSEARKWGLDILNLRKVDIQANKKKGILEKSTPLNGMIVKNAFSSVLQSMKKIVATFTNHWQLTNAKCLLTNEIVMLSAFYRKHNSPTNVELGEISKRLMLSMIRKSTTGGSTQAMTTEACNAMRTAAPATLLDDILNTKKLESADLGNIEQERSKKPKSALGIDSMIFQMMKLYIFRKGATDIFSKTHKLTRATFSMDDVDHFYPKTKLKKHSELEFRRNHLANFVLMSQWSNRSKGGKWPYSVIDSHKVWPKNKADRDNWSYHILPRKTSSGPWAQKPGRNFNVKAYLDFLRWRSKLWAKGLNGMLKDIETNGF